MKYTSHSAGDRGYTSILSAAAPAHGIQAMLMDTCRSTTTLYSHSYVEIRPWTCSELQFALSLGRSCILTFIDCGGQILEGSLRLENTTRVLLNMLLQFSIGRGLLHSITPVCSRWDWGKSRYIFHFAFKPFIWKWKRGHQRC